MRVFLVILIGFILSSSPVLSQESEDDYKKTVTNFVQLVQQRNWDALSDKIVYPLRRQYPLPDIENKQDFLKRHRELFDDSLINMVSTLPMSEWRRVGWRGIMLGHGLIWLEYDGRLKAVNYQSAVEAKRITKLIAADKAAIHASLRNYERPLYLFGTTRYDIRVDEMKDGKLRYSSWSGGKKTSQKPDLVIYGGKYVPQGTSGDRMMEFKHKGYTYELEVYAESFEDIGPARLTVKKGDETILIQRMTIFGE